MCDLISIHKQLFLYPIEMSADDVKTKIELETFSSSSSISTISVSYWYEHNNKIVKSCFVWFFPLAEFFFGRTSCRNWMQNKVVLSLVHDFSGLILVAIYCYPPFPNVLFFFFWHEVFFKKFLVLFEFQCQSFLRRPRSSHLKELRIHSKSWSAMRMFCANLSSIFIGNS